MGGSIMSLDEVRRKTGIMPAEPIEKVDAMVELLKQDDTLAKKAKEVLCKYKEFDVNIYSKGSASITAAAAIKIASILLGREPITLVELRKNFGISEESVGSRYNTIAESLNLYTGHPLTIGGGRGRRYLTQTW